MNWHERIDRAKRDGGFTEEDVKFSGKWVTCACGDQDPRIPRDAIGAPVSEELRADGVAFCQAVVEGDHVQAGYILARIELESARILRQITREGEIPSATRKES